MGNADTKLSFRKAVVQITTKSQPIDVSDNTFWEQFWAAPVQTVDDVFAMVPAPEIRALREESPSNLATLCYKLVERLSHAADGNCTTNKDQQAALNCTRLLTRILPYIFEDPDWQGFFWSSVPTQSDGGEIERQAPLAETLLQAISTLLFYPDFTVYASDSRGGSETVADVVKSLDPTEFIWEAGVGATVSQVPNIHFEAARVELLRLLLTCFSEVIYRPPARQSTNPWLVFFTSTHNSFGLALFASLLNSVINYDPVGFGVPYNHIMFTDHREPMFNAALQVLCTCLDPTATGEEENLFISYLTRLHRDEDMEIVLAGITRLLANPLHATYFPGSMKRVACHQELLILVWRLVDLNKKFLFYMLKSSSVLDILIPVLYHLNHARNDASQLGLMHICIFLLLLLSGERNFGVRLNKPYTGKLNMDLPPFTGYHGDLLILTIHRLITAGEPRLQPLYDCLLTIVANVSPYLKSLCMITASKIIHLLDTFSAPWFLYSSPTAHHYLFFLLETVNNLIQYQFDGNAALAYTIIRKRAVFYSISNLATDSESIHRALTKRGARREGAPTNVTGAINFGVAPTLDSMTEAQSVEGERVSSSAVFRGAEHSQLLGAATSGPAAWSPQSEWAETWKSKLPLQTIMRLLQVLVPQVEKICIDKALTDEAEILKFLKNGTLVGLLPVPHPILIRKYQPNAATNQWFTSFLWSVVYVRQIAPAIWYDTGVRMFEVSEGEASK